MTSVLPSVNDDVSTQDCLAFAARWLAYALLCRCFAVTCTGADARLEANEGSDYLSAGYRDMPADVLVKYRTT